MKEAMEAMRELMTPTGHWVIKEEDGGAIVFNSAEGRSVRYVANNKKEKHQLANGTIETNTKWDDGRLRQEIDLGTGMKVVRVFAVSSDEVPQLTVSMTMEGGPGGRGGRQPPGQFVYDRDER